MYVAKGENMNWKLGMCARCGALIKRREPASFAVCNRDHEPIDVSLSFPFTEEDQKAVKKILRRLRRQRKRLGKNSNDVPLTMESVTLVALWIGLQEIKKMNAAEVLEGFKEYGIES